MKWIAAVLATVVLAGAVPAAARPVTDCPLREAPFSIDTPLIDLLSSPAAKAVLEKKAPQFTRMPPALFGSKPPTFAAILSLRAAAKLGGSRAEALGDVDATLRALPVTASDKIARCERYDNDVPRFDLPKGKPRLLLFEKITGYRDGPSVDGAHAALVAMAQRNGWALVTTQSGGAFNPATLRRFDAVIWNNISGDVLTLSQRKAFEDWMERGGAFLGIHGSAGDPVYYWDWYADRLIGARFLGHPMGPQFQDARVVADPAHPLASAIPREWTMNDEWYSFSTNPRRAGARVLATLDESTYSPVGTGKLDLRMGDHPIAWTNCIGKGRSFYSAIGHRPETYSDPRYVEMLQAAIRWATVAGKAECGRTE